MFVDPALGAFVTVGLGVFVEVMRDVAMRRFPRTAAGGSGSAGCG